MSGGAARHGWWPTRREIAIVLAAILIGGLLGWMSRSQRTIQRGAPSDGAAAAATAGAPAAGVASGSSRATVDATATAAEVTLSRSLVTALIDATPSAAVLEAGGRTDPIDPTRRSGEAPIRLNTAVLGVFGVPIVPVGVEGDGQLELPAVDQVGWYRFGARPGEAGTVVLAAHVAYSGTPGVFARIGELAAGDRVLLESEAGTFSEWEVTSQALYAKSELPVDELFRTAGSSELILVTCGGAIDPEHGNYGENVVVRAKPVG